MTEGIGSKHFILCDNCGKTFRTPEGYKEHRQKPCQHPKVTSHVPPTVK